MTSSTQPTGPRSSLDRVRNAVDALGLAAHSSKRDSFMAQCPVHAERTGSLSVTWVSGQRGGMVLLHCHGCAATAAEFAEALGLSMPDLFDEPLPPRERRADGTRIGRPAAQRRSGARRGKLGRLPAPIVPVPHASVEDDVAHEWRQVATYPYTELDGQIVEEVIREECTSCGARHKRFRQEFVTSAGQRVKRKPAGFRPVLYRMPELVDAIAAGRRVWLLEGEKDVEAAVAAGQVATTNAQGGRAFPAELAQLFSGADVGVVLDRDDAGWDRGVALHRQLRDVEAREQLFLPATLEAKSDLSDHLDAGHAFGDLVPVRVEEVQAWATLAAARKKHVAVETCLAEAQAQLAARDDAAHAGDERAAGEHARHARRWAMESEIRFEALRGLVDDLAQLVIRAGTPWSGQAMAEGADVLRQATTAARSAHQLAGLAVPPTLQLPAEVDEKGTAGGTASTAAAAAGRGDSAPDADAGVASGPGLRGGTQQWAGQGRRPPTSGTPIEQPIYRIHDGCIVQIDTAARRSRRGRDEDDDSADDEVLKLVLGLDVRIVEMEYLEDPDTVDVETPQLMGRESRAEMQGMNPPGPAVLSAIVISYTQPETGEAMQMRIPAEDYKDGGWLESLPGPPAYDSKPSGMARLRDAIKAVSGEIRTTTRHRWTGWRQDKATGQWMFVHAGGAISADGVRPVPVLLSGPLARYDLPDPTTDAVRLRESFVRDSAGMLSQLPGRVAAPLLGHVYRSALGPCPWVLTLVGPPGSYKTSIASLAMHHWGELWDRRKPASSMSGNGDTLNALRIKLNAAKDALYWADDVAPTKDWGTAQKLLEEFARLVHNGEQRSRSTRDGLNVLDGTPPRSSAMITSEVMPRPGSGAQRMLVLPLQADQIDIEQLIALDEDRSRHGRALLMASLLHWLARDLTGHRSTFLAEAERYAERQRVGGETVRQAEAIGHTWAGWSLMTRFLLDAGAITDTEAELLLARVNDCLQEALVATTDPDMPSRTGARVRELLAHALRTGLSYVDDVRTGDAPPWPEAGRLGWRRTQISADELGVGKYRMEARGIRLGYVLHDPSPQCGERQLLVESTALEQVLKASAAQMTDGMQLDRGTAIRALHDEGVLIAEEQTGHTPRYTVQRTIYCENGRRCRVTALRLAQLLGDDPDGSSPLPDGPPPAGPPHDAPETAGQPDDTSSAADARPLFDIFNPTPPSAELTHATTPCVDGSQQQGLASMTPPDTGPTSPGKEQHHMRHADSDRHEADSVRLDPAQPCLICGGDAGLAFDGQPMHVPCWWSSTAASRAVAVTHRVTQQQNATQQSAQPAVATAPSPDATKAAAPGRAAQSSRTPGAAESPAGAVAAPAAVLHTDGVWLPDGRRLDLPSPLQHVGHLAELVTTLGLGTQVTKWRRDPGQLWVTPAALASLGLDPAALGQDVNELVTTVRDRTREHPMVREAIADGWQLGGSGDCLSAWTRVWRGEMRGVWIALIAAMNPDPRVTPVLGDDPTPATLARRLALFADALKAPWTLSGSTTGFNLATALRWKDRERLFAPHEPVPPAADATLERDWNWSREPTTEERRDRFVHAYDRGGSYAAGIAGLELGIGTATHHPDGRDFDPKLPGYWRYEVPAAGDWRHPYLLKPSGKTNSLPVRPVWGTTPTLQLAYELGYEVPILEAYTWSEHARVLDPWYERIRDARTALDVDDGDAQLARDLLKVVYTRTIGMLGSEEFMTGRPGYAPDRRHHIVAKARNNILRRILQIGRDTDRWPVAVIADTVVYTSDDPNPVTAWPGKPEHLGRRFGAFKPEASGLLADQLRYLAGDGYRGKDHLERDWHEPDEPGEANG